MRRLTLLAAMSLATLSCYGGTTSEEKPAKIIYDTEFPRGRGYFNFDKDIPSAQFAVAHWPGPIVFATAPIGNEVLTGPALQATPKSNPVRREPSNDSPTSLP
ncbi:MAG: hypothetical protein ABIP48_15015 [Planctomycetota bacterium]